MRLISYEKDSSTGIGIMTDETNFVSLSAAAPNLPTSMMGLLNHEGGWRRQAATAGKSADLSHGDVTLFCQ